jgi:hypothetical protein
MTSLPESATVARYIAPTPAHVLVPDTTSPTATAVAGTTSIGTRVVNRIIDGSLYGPRGTSLGRTGVRVKPSSARTHLPAGLNGNINRTRNGDCNRFMRI